MLYTVPHYYPKFQCSAGACTDTCCAGWQIVIDDQTKKKYFQMGGALGERLLHCVDWKTSSFRQYQGRCAFLNEDNLCDLYSEAGPKALCRTCRNYPRHIEEFEGVREISLSLSCVEAAKLILGCKEPVGFLSKETDREESYEEFDFFLYTKLLDTRDVMIKLLQNRNVEISVRMTMVLSLAHDLQRRIRDGKLYETEKLLLRYQKETAPEQMEEKRKAYQISGKERYLIMKELISVLEGMEVLKPDWQPDLSHWQKVLYGGGAEAYEKLWEAFSREELAGEAGKQWEIWPEQLMVYFLFTYFCGAVYDEQPYEKVKLAVFSTLLIRELVCAVFTERKSPVTLEDLVEISHRYSKEAEHSDLNLQYLEHVFRTQEQFSLKNLIRVI